MKIAKVVKGIVQHVWPDTITKKDGRVIEVPVPNHILSYEKKGLPLPDCFVEVPDDVQRGFVWNGTAYAKVVKVMPPPPPKPHSDLLEVVAEKLGVTHDDLWAEVEARKKARGLTPPKSKG